MSMFTDHVEKFVPPKKGRQHILRIIREMLYFEASSRQTDLEKALEHLHDVIRRRSIIFIISDFLDHGYEKILRITSRRHDCIPIVIEDPRERLMPNANCTSPLAEPIQVNSTRRAGRPATGPPDQEPV